MMIHRHDYQWLRQGKAYQQTKQPFKSGAIHDKEVITIEWRILRVFHGFTDTRNPSAAGRLPNYQN
ncbi:MULTISPECIES: hypothetical protein [Halomonadaceae]|uniref:Transposase n=1 Tax=Vreelandella malpeensis TaxID=1172368 RepID=A0ABS8DYV7_9GAMM|nr:MULTISPECIES: hypothetical protein [Halomonas]MCB8890765.1 hypothetical protein [Halomonas malpeensis]UDM06113.1 hypothetical protein LG409_11980 [Halomonas sp. NyZ770]